MKKLIVLSMLQVKVSYTYMLRLIGVGHLNACVSLIVLLTLFMSVEALAQDVLKPRVSPLAITSIRYKDAYLKIVYSQPQKNGREIFGKLVPFDEVWRTGANEATEITTTQDILVNDKLILKAGTYSLFTVPNKEKWTIIFNKDLGLWGAYNYDYKKDALRFDVDVKTIEQVCEPFTISVDQKTDTSEIILKWDKTQISFPIKFI